MRIIILPIITREKKAYCWSWGILRMLGGLQGFTNNTNRTTRSLKSHHSLQGDCWCPTDTSHLRSVSFITIQHCDSSYVFFLIPWNLLINGIWWVGGLCVYNHTRKYYLLKISGVHSFPIDMRRDTRLKFTHVIDYVLGSLLNSYAEALTPSAMVFGRGLCVLRFRWGHGGGSPHDGTGDLYKGIKGPMLPPFPPRKDTTGSQLSAATEPNHTSTLIMGFQPSRLGGK